MSKVVALVYFVVFLLFIYLFMYLLFYILTAENLTKMGYMYFKEVLNYSIPYTSI